MNVFWNVAHHLYQTSWGGVMGRLFEVISFTVGSNAISAKAQVGNNTVFHHHGVGCVIHDNAIIGAGCHIFQNVTIGSKWSKGICDGGCPVIGNDVFIGAGAVILGDIKIGDHAVIGANAVVTRDVPAYATCAGVPGKIIEKEGNRIC